MITDPHNEQDSLVTLTTKRRVIAQVSLCKGCCCGNIGRGKPDVPVERLKQEWKSRGLSKFIQLSISGCLGPCDIINVVRISSLANDVWLGHFRSIDDYLTLVNWAERSKSAGEPVPLSPRMKAARFDPFRAIDGRLSNVVSRAVDDSHTESQT